MKSSCVRAGIILGLVTICILVSFCACVAPNNDGLPQYEKLEARSGEIYVEDVQWLDYSVGQIIVTAVEGLQEYGLTYEKYSEQYFETNALVLIAFQYSSSEKDITFKDLAVKGSKIYPIFELNGVAPDELSSDDQRCNIYSIECAKEILDYQLEKVIVINRNNMDGGSYYYESIKKYFA